MTQQGRNKGVTGLIDLLQPGTLANIFVEPFATTGNLIGYNNWATSAELGSVSPVVSGGFVVGVNGQTTAAQNTGAAALDPTKDFTLSFTFKKLAGSQNTDDRIVIEIGDVDGYSINIEIGYSTSEGVSADQVSIVVGDSTAGIITGTTVAAPWGSTHTLVFAVKHLMASTITVDGVLAANVSISHITDLIASTIYILGEEPSGSPLAAIGNMIIAGNSTAMPPIQAQIVGFGSALTAKPVLTTGPGDAQADTWYGSNVGGSGSAHGKVQSQQSPYPPTLYNLQGTITHQADTGCTISFPALITKMETERDASTNDTWTINVEWTKNGPHVVVWNGSAVSYAQPALSIKEVNDGSERTDDPFLLTDSALTHLFFPTQNGTDSAYQDSSTSALIAAYLVSASPPRSNLKVVTAQSIRLDDNAVMLLVRWGPNDTKDEYELPATVKHADPQNLQSSATVGNINGTTGTLTGFALRSIENKFVTAGGTGNYFNISEFGLRTTVEDITLPGTYVDSDPNDLDTIAKTTLVQASSAPSFSAPSGLKVIHSTTIQLTSSLGTNNQYQTVFSLAKKDSADDILMPGNVTETDPNDLDTTGKHTIISTNSAPTYSAPSGLKIANHFTVQLTNTSGTNNQYQTVWNLTKKDSADDVLIPNIWTANDPQTLSSQTSVAAIDASPSLPAGFKSLYTHTQAIVPGHTLTITKGALRNTADELLFPQTLETRSAMKPWVSSQPFLIASSGDIDAQATSEWATFQSVANAIGLKLVPHTDSQRVIVYEYLNPGIQLQGYTEGGGRWQMARINSGTPQLFIASNKSAGTGQRIITFQRQWVIDKPIRRFAIWRNITGTTIPEQGPATINSVTLPLIGQANDGTFIGLASGTAIFKGPLYSTNLALSGTLPFFMGYDFYTDATGVVVGILEDWFKRPQRLATLCTATGWVDITPGTDSSTAIGVLSTVDAPTQASFAAFLA